MHNKGPNPQFGCSQFGRSPVKLSKSLQQQLLNAITEQGANPGAGLPQIALVDLLQGAPIEGAGLPHETSVKLTKRHLDKIPQSAAKKARSTNTQHQTANKIPVLQQPKPKLKPPYASFLETFIDPIQLEYRRNTNSTHRFVLKWLASVAFDRNTHCRSDSYLYPSHDSPIPRRLTRSASAMDSIQDPNSQMAPPPSTEPSQVETIKTKEDGNVTEQYADMTEETANGELDIPDCESAIKSLVEQPTYREKNLAQNGICLCTSYEGMPKYISNLVRSIQRHRTSRSPSLSKVKKDLDLQNLATSTPEFKVEDYFQRKVFPTYNLGNLEYSKRQPMSKHTVPNTGSNLKVSNPKPDLIYGYHWKTFSEQMVQLISMGDEMIADNCQLLYPFFVIEFKGGNGKMWVALNQCLGGSASCVNMAERLHHRLKQCQGSKVQLSDTSDKTQSDKTSSSHLSDETQSSNTSDKTQSNDEIQNDSTQSSDKTQSSDQTESSDETQSNDETQLSDETQSTDKTRLINTATFSIAMNSTEAQLYITWKHNDIEYYMKHVRSFLLQDPRHFIEFHRCVLNIIEWGKGRRLRMIRKSLNILLEEGRKRASAAAKSRRLSANSASSSILMRRKRPKRGKSSKKGKLSQPCRLPPSRRVAGFQLIQKNGHSEYEIEEILCARDVACGRGKQRQVLVSWKGYPKPTWEPVEEFEETKALDQFEEKYGRIQENDGPLSEYLVMRGRG